jgi:hypothetical protein
MSDNNDNNSSNKQSWLVPIVLAVLSTISAIAVAWINRPQQSSDPSKSPSVSPSLPTATPLPSQIPSSPTSISTSLVDNWKRSDGIEGDCLIVFNKDDGKNIEGSCDNDGFSHKIVGTYNGLNANTINITISRTNKSSGCMTTVDGNIKIISRDRIRISQSGWDGCGASTPSVETLLSRQ